MKVKVVATGSQYVNEQLDKLKASEAKKIVRTASREALKPLQARCKSTCPVKQGAMRRSIRVRAITRSRKFVGSKVTVGNEDNAYQGDQFYAAFIVFGRKTGSRRNTRARIERRMVRALRNESRAAGALGKSGSSFRSRQEAYFQREGKRLADQKKVPERRQIKPNDFMQDAVKDLEDHVRTDYYRRIGLGVRSLLKK